ncbi:hypothetical protein SUDANB180_07520 [Streptomyces sp. enrichment culture]
MAGALRRLRPSPRRDEPDRLAVHAVARGAGDAVRRPQLGGAADAVPLDHRPVRSARGWSGRRPGWRDCASNGWTSPTSEALDRGGGTRCGPPPKPSLAQSPAHSPRHGPCCWAATTQRAACSTPGAAPHSPSPPTAPWPICWSRRRVRIRGRVDVLGGLGNTARARCPPGGAPRGDGGGRRRRPGQHRTVETPRPAAPHPPGPRRGAGTAVRRGRRLALNRGMARWGVARKPVMCWSRVSVVGGTGCPWVRSAQQVMRATRAVALSVYGSLRLCVRRTASSTKRSAAVCGVPVR